MKYIVYGKEGCLYCVKASEMLGNKGLTFEYVELKDNKQVDDLIATVKDLVGSTIKTVPQIIAVDGTVKTYIGGYKELANVLNNTKQTVDNTLKM